MTKGEGTKRHCMVVHAYYPLGETRVQREAAALRDRGYEVDVICLRGQGEPAREHHDGVAVHRLPVGRHRGHGMAVQLLEYLVFFVMATIRLSWLHLSRRYRSVQVHNLPDFLVFAAVFPKATGTPVILDLHDLMPEFFAARLGLTMDHPLVRLVLFQERIACRFADHVITVTEGWRETLAGRSVPMTRSTVVMNVADSALFRRETSEIVPLNGKFEMIYHGTFTRRYGVDLAIEALNRVRDDLPQARLTLLGDGDTRSELKALTESLGLTDRVTFSEGMVDVNALPGALRRAQVGIVPNRSNVFTDEILPTKLMELVAVGTPVIVARTPGVEAYFDDTMVRYFEPDDVDDLADAIRDLALRADRRDELIDRSDEFNRSHSWEAVSARYVDLVDRVGAAAGASGGGTVVATSSTVPPRHTLVRSSDEPDDPRWDRFLEEHGHHTQTSLWGQIKASMGWQAARVVAEREGRIVGGAQILMRQLPVGGNVGFVSRGPVLAEPDAAVAGLVMDEIERLARRLGMSHLTIQPPSNGTVSLLEGEKRRMFPGTAEVTPRATILIDLSDGLGPVLAGMTPRTRYNTKVGGRKGIEVREGGKADLDTFYGMLRKTADRQGFAPFPRAYFGAMWRVLNPPGHLRLALADVDGEPVAAQLVIAFGDTVVNKMSVWSGLEGSRRPNEALQWATLEWAVANGYRTYDLEGIKLSAAEALLRGDPLPDTLRQSVTSYKLGFGGEITVAPPPLVHVANPALRWAFSEVYPRVMDHRRVKALVRSVRTRPVGSESKVDR